MFLKRKLKRRYKDAGEIYKEFIRHSDWCVESITEFLNSIPDADVEEVVHGKWVEDGYYDNPCVCSYCGVEAMHDNKTPKTYIRSPYCWSCGAKMDGGNVE